MAKFVFVFLTTLSAAYVFFTVFSKRDRKLVSRGLKDLVVPAIVALVAVAAALFLSINPPMKVI